MNQKRKAGILLVSLAIPVFIWLFLKNFGQNRFELPVYYETEVPELSECQSLAAPHRVSIYNPSTEVESNIFSSFVEKATVSYVLPAVCETDCQLVMEQLANLQFTFPEKPGFQIVVIASDDKFNESDLQKFKSRYEANSETWKFVLVNKENYDMTQNCDFLLSEIGFDHPLVLTDRDAFIRGYYRGNDADEIDRLKGELKILFYMQEKVNHVKDSK